MVNTSIAKWKGIPFIWHQKTLLCKDCGVILVNNDALEMHNNSEDGDANEYVNTLKLQVEIEDDIKCEGTPLVDPFPEN